MPITIYAGKIGSGKTVSMIRDLYPLRDTTILSNMNLNKKVFKNFKPITIEDIKNYKEWKYNNMTVVLDEIHTIMDSRKSGTNMNTILSYWFLQSRKRHVNIFGTTQFIHQLEKRVRNNIDYLLECECYKKHNSKSMYKDDKGIPSDFWIKLRLFDSGKQKFTRKEIYYSNQYFCLYDTYEIIDFYGNTPQNKILTNMIKYIKRNIPETQLPKLYKLIQHYKKNEVI